MLVLEVSFNPLWRRFHLVHVFNGLLQQTILRPLLRPGAHYSNESRSLQVVCDLFDTQAIISV